MVRAVIVAAVICLAAVVLAVEEKEENQVNYQGIQWCSDEGWMIYCKEGFHCCSPLQCCPNDWSCCPGGQCCAYTNSPQTPYKIPAIDAIRL